MREDALMKERRLSLCRITVDGSLMVLQRRCGCCPRWLRPSADRPKCLWIAAFVAALMSSKLFAWEPALFCAGVPLRMDWAQLASPAFRVRLKFCATTWRELCACWAVHQSAS